MPGFRKYYRLTLIKPSLAFSDLVKEEGLVRLSFLAVLITAILYTLVYVFLILGGGQPYKPWLDIPPEIYYRYNVFFCAPSMFLGWILASALVHLISRLFVHTGCFEQTLSVFGFGISIASWATGIHDIITSFLGAFHFIDQHTYETALNSPTIWRTLLWIQMLGYLVWFVILFSRGTKVVYEIKKWQSVFLGLTGFITYQMFFFIFNR